MTARSITATLALAAFAAFAPSVSAQSAADKKTDKPAMAHPKPAAEMADLKIFDGKWSCSGEGAMEPGGAMMKMDSSVTGRSDLGGFWKSGVVKGAPMAGGPPFEGMYHMTWDSAGKKYVMFWVDNMGGWAQSASPAWQADKLVFTGDSQMGDMKARVRDTFTRNANGTLGHVSEMEVGGRWTKMMDETCRRP